MLKFVLVLCVAVAFIMPMHETQALKFITINKGVSYSAPAAAPAAPAFDPTPLIQGVQSTIAGKLQLVQSLVGSIIQQKLAFKQNALNSIQSTTTGVKSQVQGYAGSIGSPFVIRKNIYIGGAPRPSAAAPEATTTTGYSVTTLKN